MGSAVAALVPFVQSLSLAEGTKSAYASHIKFLRLACEAFDVDPLVLTSDDVCAVALFFALGHSVHSLDSFLSACVALYSEHGLMFPRSTGLKNLTRGLKRLFLVSDTPAQAFPLSQNDVSAILSSLDSSLPLDIIFGCWLSASFLFALRPEDLEKLRWCDVVFSKDGGIDITIRPGKGAVVRGAQTFSASPNPSVLNPSFWFKRGALASPPGSVSSEAFVLRNLDPESPKFLCQLPRSHFSARLTSQFSKALLRPPPPRLTPYSLRRGAASAYYEADTRETFISQLLRHKSWSTTAGYIDSTKTRDSRRRVTSKLISNSSSTSFLPSYF